MTDLVEFLREHQRRIDAAIAAGLQSIHEAATREHRRDDYTLVA